MPLLPLMHVGQGQKTAIANWHFFSNQGSKRNSFTGLKEEDREICERGRKAAQLPSGPLAARFTKISSSAPGLHCYPLALSSLTLLRFSPLLPGHFSLFYLLRSVGVQRSGGMRYQDRWMEQRRSQGRGWKLFVLEGKVFPWFCPPGQETTWHNMRGTIAGQLHAHARAHRQTHVAVLGGNDADWSPLSSGSFTSGQGAVSCGQFSGGFSFPKGRWVFPGIIHMHFRALNYTFLLWLSRVNCGGLKHANVESSHCVYHTSHIGEILVSKDSGPTYLMNTITFYYFL